MYVIQVQKKNFKRLIIQNKCVPLQPQTTKKHATTKHKYKLEILPKNTL